MSEWQCEVCNYRGHPRNLKKVKEVWGEDYYCECPKCESEYTNDCVSNRAKGEICAFCGEFVEEVIEVVEQDENENKISYYMCMACFDVEGK